MFFVLSKILAFTVQPFAWIVLLVLIGLIAKRKGLKKWSYRLAGIAVLFFTNSIIFLEFARMWEMEGTKIEEVGDYDVAIVLGGMAEYDNNLQRLSLRRGSDRLWQALHLYHLGKVDKIMLVGVNGFLRDDKLNEAVQFKEDLIDFKIPSEDIIIENKSKNTYQNAVESKKVLANYPEIEKVLLVTSAIHMRRSKACFEKAGFEAIDVFTTDHYTGAVRGYQLDQYFMPNLSVMTDWSNLLHEWVGYITYKMSGYI